MTAATGKGTAMHMDFVRVRFGRDSKPGPKPTDLSDKLPELRRLLRTDASITAIARELGCSHATLRNFIKRRRLLNMRARREFISLQKSIAGEALE